MKRAKMTVIPAGEDPELTMKILKRFIPGIDIKTIEITPGKHIETSGLARYIRLDIHAVLQDRKNVLIDMQVSAEADFVHRIRYCRSQNDGTRIIYLNAKGDTASLNEEQKVFLEYLAGNAAEDELCSEVNEKADLLKYNDRKKDMKRPGLKQSCECMREVSVWNRSVSFQT